ncbi:pantoate--beta-alanine ligase [Bacillus xiapuensis]|uniref:pantoate--beta-alanine ligase n=1 Tax=Bacillus xiapuensis TaxID=2014075 RepID=UPI000C24616C|nr:pantoate--beta-alanine ligase [Bacillus xiapuensis]
MRVIRKITELRAFVQAQKASGCSIGLVPTMGYLHEGHLALARKAREDNETVIMTIFVNPLQFGPAEDFDSYPRDLARDRLQAEAAGVDLLFAPEVEEMYPKQPAAALKVLARTNCLCGKKRPGHFDGVATVLTKLFHLMQPDRAYFGMKDAQQAAVIEGMVESLNFPLEVVTVETVREADGLAKSSRNVHLTPEEREAAPQIYQALLKGQRMIEQGERHPAPIIQEIASHLQKYSRAAIDYVELLSYPELEPVKTIQGKIILAAAVKYSAARLIDNIVMNCE